MFGQVALTPRLYGAMIQMSDRFARRAPTAEQFIGTQLVRATAHAADQGVVNGSGSSEPLGLLNDANVASESGTSLGWTGALDMLEKLATAGLDDANVSWIAAPGVREILQAREVIATSGRFIRDADRVANWPAFATSEMPSGSLLVGDFSHVILGMWGVAPTVEINPFQDFWKGLIAARIIVAMDVALPQAGAVVKSTSVT